MTSSFCFLLYKIVLVLPHIDMNLPWVCMCSPSWTPPPTFLPIPSLWVIPVHQPRAPCSMHQTWTGDPFHIWYFTCFKAILPYHLSGSAQCTSPQHPVSCIEPRLATHFLHDSIHVSMPFSQIIPPFPSPSESKSLLYTSVSFLLSCIQGRHCHLSKFHIYVLVYCIGVFLSGLLHSV